MNFASSTCETYSSMYFHLGVFRFFFFVFPFTMLFTLHQSQGIERNFFFHCKFSNCESKRFTCDSVYNVVLIMLLYISKMYDVPHSDLSISYDQHVAYGNLLKTTISSVTHDHFALTYAVSCVMIVKRCEKCNANCQVQMSCSYSDTKKEMYVFSFITIQVQIHTQESTLILSLYSSFTTGKLIEIVITNLTFDNG